MIVFGSHAPRSTNQTSKSLGQPRVRTSAPWEEDFEQAGCRTQAETAHPLGVGAADYGSEGLKFESSRVRIFRAVENLAFEPGTTAGSPGKWTRTKKAVEERKHPEGRRHLAVGGKCFIRVSIAAPKTTSSPTGPGSRAGNAICKNRSRYLGVNRKGERSPLARRLKMDKLRNDETFVCIAPFGTANGLREHTWPTRAEHGSDQGRNQGA